MDKEYHTVCFPQFRAMAFFVFAEEMNAPIVVAVDSNRWLRREMFRESS
jgi:hypothetical protein